MSRSWCVRVAAALAPVLLVSAGQAEPPAFPAGTDARVATFLERAEAQRAAGDIPGALEILREANVLLKQSKGPNHPDVLPILEAAGRLFFESGQMQEAERPLLKAITIYEDLRTAGRLAHEADLAVCLLLLGKVRAELALEQAAAAVGEGRGAAGTADLDVARPLLQTAARDVERALEIFAAVPGIDPEIMLACRRELAVIHAAAGEVPAAIEQFRGVLAIRQRGPADDPRILSAAGDLAGLLAESGGLEEAIELESQTLAAFAAATGVRNDGGSMRPPALRYLGGLLLTGDHLARAEEAFGAAADLDARAKGNDAVETLLDRVSRCRVQMLEADSGSNDLKSLVADLESRPAGDPLVAAALRQAAEIALDRGKISRAKDLAERAATHDTEATAGSGPGDDTTLLGRILLADGDVEAARAELERGLRASVRAAGPAHPATLRVLVLLADAAARAGDRDAARSLVARLERHRLPRRGERDEAELCDAFDAVARLLGDGDDQAAGDQLRTALLDDRRRQFGAAHRHVASTLVHLGHARQRAGEHPHAIPLFREQIGILRDTVGPMHPDVATALLLLAESQRATKDFVGAEESLAEALSIWEQTVGPEHAVTRETLGALASVRLSAGKRAEAIPLLERLLAGLDDDPAADRTEGLSLVIRLAEAHQADGDRDRARQLLQRAQDMELAGGGGPDHVSLLAAIARLQRLLGDEFAAAANLSRARALAERSPDPTATTARLEAVALTGLAVSPP